MFRRLALLATLALPLCAWADGLQVKVGETKEVDVGVRRGLRCDDNSIASAEIVTDEKTQSNKVVIHGVKLGHTACRAGDLTPGLTASVIEIEVVPADPKP
jgi:hypothetical protein